jgi:hypothetical protein
VADARRFRAASDDDYAFRRLRRAASIVPDDRAARPGATFGGLSACAASAGGDYRDPSWMRAPADL